MKICPFISHMLGDDNSNAMVIDGQSDAKRSGSESKSNVVILGYDDGQSTGTAVETKPTKSKKADDTTPSHLYCLKDSCRFYQKKTGDCQFDLVFTMLEDQKKESAKPGAADMSKDISKEISKDIDKIWKFQTKSVAELIETFGDSEKNQAKSFAGLKTDLEKKIESIAGKVEKPQNGDVKKALESLQKKLEDREQSIEDLSTTFSELVLNLHESMTKLQAKSETMFKQVDKLKMPDTAAIKKAVDESVTEKLKKIEMPDIQGPIRELEKTLQTSISASSSTSELQKRLDSTLQAQKSLEEKLSTWHDKVTSSLKEMQDQHSAWEKRLSDLADQQKTLASYLEEGKKHRETEQTKSGKKEAKKYNNLGVTSFHNGAYEMARDQFLRAVKVDPEFAEAYNNLGLAYTELSDDEKASEAFARAVELNPSLHAAYNNLGYIFFKKGNYEQAIEMYNEALGRSTNNSSAYTNLGNAFYKMGNMEEAGKAWRKAIEIDPANEKARKNLQRIDDTK